MVISLVFGFLLAGSKNAQNLVVAPLSPLRVGAIHLLSEASVYALWVPP
jgi:hypothetical protein